MPLYDLPLQEMQQYRGRAIEPDDFEEFWRSSIASATPLAQPTVVRRIDSGLRLVETSDVTFSGFGGAPIRAWLHRPVGVARPPVLVRFPGYGGGRGLPHQAGFWPDAGVAVLTIDARGQGSSGYWRCDTPDPTPSSNPSVRGFMTQGVLDPGDYYYRRVVVDAVMAVRAARELPGVDADRVGVVGVSQGGGIALAVAGLVEDLWVLLCDVPFLCDVPRALDISASGRYFGPYSEVVSYLEANPDHVTQVLRTLSYVDGVLHARRATAPALFSVALMDTVCPPSGVFAAHNTYAGAKDLEVYAYADHEGGSFHQEARQLEWLLQRL